ncbi:SGNH/GDSL hydrolase family protein [Sphingomonas desiccabilis]|uniref:SGNH/GDSL hydrolase family protein n=2 Tax=Sphingomonas desiccabilis TaxID=429134 RepID=A0A4Q2IUX6_9SPHN|nr:SGNH/GDSL hydrolase family protein [Sphingomonas desiccabilis]
MIAGVAGALLSHGAQASVVPAWTASQQPSWGDYFLFPTNIPASLEKRTLRQVVRLAIGGRDVRIVLANSYGSKPIVIAGARFASSAGEVRTVPGSERAVTFGGKAVAVIAPGATVVSDPLPLAVAAGQDVAVSLYFAHAPVIESFHWDGKRTGYVLEGNALGTPTPKVATTTTARLLLAGVLVDAPEAKGTVVVMGDSITDGAGATLEAETRWPDYLAARAAPRGIAVVNAGISGARLLSDGMGRNALARLDRDVLAQPGVRTLILLLGINDIAWPGTPFDPHAPMPTLDALTAGYRAVVARAHASGVRVIGATLPPFADALPGTPMAATYYSPAKDALRNRVNAWIRTSGTFDAVVDLERVLANPAAPAHLVRAFDSGDHLHPGDAGNKAMADALDLDTLIGD